MINDIFSLNQYYAKQWQFVTEFWITEYEYYQQISNETKLDRSS